MEQNIKIIISKFLQEHIVVESWGISNIKVEDTGMSFIVDGLKYKGNLEIMLCDEGYKIKSSQDMFILKYGLENKIVDVIDGYVERTDTYLENLVKFIDDNI